MLAYGDILLYVNAQAKAGMTAYGVKCCRHVAEISTYRQRIGVSALAGRQRRRIARLVNKHKAGKAQNAGEGGEEEKEARRANI